MGGMGQQGVERLSSVWMWMVLLAAIAVCYGRRGSGPAAEDGNIERSTEM